MNPLTGITIQDFMPHTTYTVATDLPLVRAREIMLEHGFHHLPVQRCGEFVGVISARDIDEALAVHASAGDLLVGAVMREEPYAVSPGTPMRDVLSQMLTHGYGCAVVKNDGGRAIGIFTSTDAIRLLAKVFEEDWRQNENRCPTTPDGVAVNG